MRGLEIEAEELFVKKFIIKEKRNRVAYELSSKKKRHNALDSLICNIDRTKIVADLTKTDVSDALCLIDKKYSLKEPCYILYDGEQDGCRMQLEQALNHFYYYGGSVALLCGENLVFIKEEAGLWSSCERLLLWD